MPCTVGELHSQPLYVCMWTVCVCHVQLVSCTVSPLCVCMWTVCVWVIMYAMYSQWAAQSAPCTSVCGLCVHAMYSWWAEARHEWYKGHRCCDGKLWSWHRLRWSSVLCPTLLRWPECWSAKDLCQRQIVRHFLFAAVFYQRSRSTVQLLEMLRRRLAVEVSGLS